MAIDIVASHHQPPSIEYTLNIDLCLRLGLNIDVCLRRCFSFFACFGETVHQSDVLVTLKSFLHFVLYNVLSNFDNLFFVQRTLAFDVFVGFDE